MNFVYRIFALSFLFSITSCVATKHKNYTFNQKYSASQVKEDIEVMRKIYEKNHPSIYWYNTKKTIDSVFDATIESITDSLTEIQAKNKMASIISAFKCGHTSIAYSKNFIALADKYKYPQFPLSIKIWKDSMVVIGYYNKEDSLLKRGTIITSINGKNFSTITKDIFEYISTDGDAINYKYQAVSGNFPAWYRNVYGIDSSYVITYIDSSQKEKTTQIKWHVPVKDTTKKPEIKSATVVKKEPTKPTISKRQERLLKLRSMFIDTSLQTAFMKLNTFSNAGLRSFFKDFFKQVEENKIKNIVIDVRENGGGSVNATINLLQYLKDSSFKIADTCFAKNRNFEEKKYIKGWLGYWILSQFFSRKGDDGLLHNYQFEKKYYTPHSSKHFNGHIYILQGGYSFSAATIFTSFLKGQQNVTILGEETGGGYYGNSAMLTPNVYLPNTKCRVRLPLYRYVMNKEREKGFGVKPDIIINPSSEAIKKGIDLKMETVKGLIRQKNKLKQ